MIGKVTLNIETRTVGLDLLQASLGSIAGVLATCGAETPLEIESEGLAITFMDAPLVEIDTRPRIAPGEVIVETTFRPAGGLGLLVGIATLRCSPRALRSRWEEGWPIVELLSEPEALEAPPPRED